MASYRYTAAVLFFCLFCSLRALADPSVALFYGANPPLDELKAFDVVVVDPDQPGTDPRRYHHSDSELFAYVSVGEVSPDRGYFQQIPQAWLKGENRDWGSRIIDQSDPQWPKFFADTVIAPLWQKGFRGFFLDTLDSYQRLAKSPADRARQEAGLKQVIFTIKQRWPQARLILNRGFEILPDVHQQVWMVAAESLFHSWDAASKSYTQVSDSDREWLLGQLHKVQQDYRLPVLVIDYVPPGDRQQARDAAQAIRGAGFIPYVSTPELDTLGVGNVEVLPRKVLVIYEPKDAEDLFYADAVRFLGMPFAYLGLVPEFHSVDEPLPDYPLTGRYAGVVSWLNSDEADRGNYMNWLLKQVDAHVPVAVFSHFGFGYDTTAFGKLGLSVVNGGDDKATTSSYSIGRSDAMMGFELPLKVQSTEIQPVGLSSPGHSLLELNGGDQKHYVPAAITNWGGYVLSPYAIGEVGMVEDSERWYVNPLSFLRAALRLDPSVPVPDVTTETGRRLLMVHIDGDGYPSKAERPGYPVAGQVLLDDILKQYRIPTSLSIIEGEVGPTGLYPDESPKLEAVARESFALPWVEVASHTYSHPFRWSEEQAKAMEHRSKPSNDPDYLPIKGYQLDVNREVTGAARYISHLSPRGKPVKIIFWPGDCVPTAEALALSYKDGLLNINGGDTVITHRTNSWTNIAGLGFTKKGYFQVFAPNENENVYTNLWSGPFYGYERVIETFQMTDAPYRFKPIDIYYHPYSVTKTASLNALKKVYDWALHQDVNPIYISEYIEKVLDFNQMVVARTPNGFRVRGDGALRTVRLLPGGAAVDLERSPQVAGYAPGPNARYLSLASGSADIVLARQGTASLPYIESANARLTSFQRHGQGFRASLRGYQNLDLTLANAGDCQLYEQSRLLQPASRNGGRLHYELAHDDSNYDSDAAGRALRLDCGA